MIELTEQQVEALERAAATPPRVVNPRTRETFVLLRVDEYERLLRSRGEQFTDSFGQSWVSNDRVTKRGVG